MKKGILLYLLAIAVLMSFAPISATSIKRGNEETTNETVALEDGAETGIVSQPKGERKTKTNVIALARDIASFVDYSALIVINRLYALVSFVITLVFIAVFISRMKLLSKTGKNGTLAIIPFYGRYVEFDAYWITDYFWPYVADIVSVVYFATASKNSPILYFVLFFCVFALYVLNAMFKTNLYKSFKCNTALVVLDLLLLGWLANLIVIFSEHEYEKQDIFSDCLEKGVINTECTHS